MSNPLLTPLFVIEPSLTEVFVELFFVSKAWENRSRKNMLWGKSVFNLTISIQQTILISE